jgi:phospholipid/cholesterol/gamma-HCH transport system substrate-binding protein
MRRIRILAALLVLAVTSTACAIASASDSTTLTAVFPSTNNLFVGSEVRILGLQVGEVLAIEPTGDVVRVELRVDGTELPAELRADLKPTSLLGERFVQLGPPYAGGEQFPDGGEVPLSRTSVPVDIDEVLRSFDNFLRSLDRDVLATLIDTLADTFEGQGEGLNQLLDQGSESVRVLADSTEDLNALVAEFATLNETLATRDQVIGRTLDRFSIILTTLIEEREEIIASVANLRRLVVELRPLLDDHTDPLIADLETLATTLSTVERNLDRVGELIRGGRTLFEGAGRAFEFDTGRLALNNQTGRLGEAIQLRLTDRLVGLCIRLDVEECQANEFFEPILGAILCAPEGPSCLEQQSLVTDYLTEALRSLPPEVIDTLVEESRAEAQAVVPPDDAPAETPPPAAPPRTPELERPPSPMPLPDPRLGGAGDDGEERGGLLGFGRAGGDR